MSDEDPPGEGEHAPGEGEQAAGEPDAPGDVPAHGEPEREEPAPGRAGSRDDPLDRIEPPEDAPASSREEVDEVWDEEVGPMDDEAPSG